MKLAHLATLATALSLGTVAHAAIRVQAHMVEQQVDRGTSQFEDWQIYLTVFGEGGDQYTLTSRTGATGDASTGGVASIERPSLADLLADATGTGAWTLTYTPLATSVPSTYRVDLDPTTLSESSLFHPTITSPAAGSISGPNVSVSWSPAADAFGGYATVVVNDPFFRPLYEHSTTSFAFSVTGLPAGSAYVQIYPAITVGLSETHFTLTHLSGPDLDFDVAPNVEYESWVTNTFTVVPEPASLAAVAGPAAAAFLFRRGRRARA